MFYWRRRRTSERNKDDNNSVTQSTPALSPSDDVPCSAMTAGDKENASGAAFCYTLAGPGSPTSVYSAAQPVEASAIYSCAKGTESEVYDNLQRQPIKQVIIDNVYSHCSAPNVFKTK
ncbi:uncharacterized protein [Littorina saxatilis]|uniref:uncharacterized protein n=1 Tax=Littorina saxatilis TaxID=31220 RepID=UPI0038B5ACC4